MAYARSGSQGYAHGSFNQLQGLFHHIVPVTPRPFHFSGGDHIARCRIKVGLGCRAGRGFETASQKAWDAGPFAKGRDFPCPVNAPALGYLDVDHIRSPGRDDAVGILWGYRRSRPRRWGFGDDRPGTRDPPDPKRGGAVRSIPVPGFSIRERMAMASALAYPWLPSTRSLIPSPTVSRNRLHPFQILSRIQADLDLDHLKPL